jgi:hypothetical protein
MADFSTKGDFAYRKNLDGSTDLICVHCFKTVITALDMEAVRKAEATHICKARRQRGASTTDPSI